MTQEENREEIIKLKIPSKAIFIRKTRQVIDEICERASFPKKKTQQLKLAINEALANIISYAYNHDPDKVIYIYFLIIPERIEVVIRDFGKKPDLAKMKPRDLNKLDDKGLGLLIMEKFVDYMAFDFSPEIGTELKFVKNRD